MTPKYGPSRLENAKCPFNCIACLCMLKVKKFLVVLRCHRSMTKFLEMVSNPSIRGQKIFSICVTPIYQVVISWNGWNGRPLKLCFLKRSNLNGTNGFFWHIPVGTLKPWGLVIASRSTLLSAADPSHPVSMCMKFIFLSQTPRTFTEISPLRFL